jgi:hypothetical protein
MTGQPAGKVQALFFSYKKVFCEFTEKAERRTLNAIAVAGLLLIDATSGNRNLVTGPIKKELFIIQPLFPISVILFL